MKDKTVMGVAAHCDDIDFLFAGTLLKYHEKFDYRIVYVESTNNMSGSWSVNDSGKPELPPGDFKRSKREYYPGRFTWDVPWFIEMPQRKRKRPTPPHVSARNRFFWIIRSGITMMKI